jgi:hypothetical protein
MISPLSSAADTAAAAISEPGSRVSRSFTSSIAAIGPIPRTSPIAGWREAISFSRAWIRSPTSTARARKSGSAIAFRLSTAAAHATGFPP